MKTSLLTLAITPGSEEGVGPELMLRAMNSADNRDNIRFIWCGDRASLELASIRAQLPLRFAADYQALIDNHITIICMDDYQGVIPKAAWFLQNAVMLAQQKKVNALVTGPIEKGALAFGDGEHFVGQTEYFARHLGEGQKSMMSFMGGAFIMSLFSTHVPLRNVADILTKQSLTNHLLATAHHTGKILKKNPEQVSIAVLGLNPHAGENGLIGHEDQTISMPVIKTLNEQGFSITGPLPADGFFAYFHLLTPQQIPDVVVAMYHDQGLIPYKLLAQGRAVNVTLGLRVPRVSPAHGTAPDLAGKNVACVRSSIMAIQIAADLSLGNL